ncbi:MAG: trypsin-like peptidase domain-containing protein, partial [Woeseiaceae bacterium]
GLASVAAGHAEVLPEEVFEHASDYTVRVKTRIEHAFGGDAIGSFGGTGFIVDADRGWVVTNRHVVGESPSEVHVARRDGPYEPATKLYVAPYIDIASLETRLDGGREAEMDCGRAAPGTGHPVGAYGHPWGFEYTGTQGVISGRTTKWERLMLQTDAPINSGNSGGPLISMRTGAVVGVNTSKYNDENAENTNFAIPVEDVCQIVALLKEGRDPAPPKLPVAFFNLGERDAVVIAKKFDDQAAVDLQAYDRIVAAGPDLKPVKQRHDLMNALRGNLDGARLKVIRDGRELEITADIPPMRIRRGVEFAGIVMAPFNYKDGSITPAGHDIGVFSVAAGSPASGKDLKVFDLIHRVNGQQVESLEQLFILLNDLEDGAIVKLEFLRVFEDMHYFGYIQRELRAEPAVWLDSNGASSGTGIQLSWIESELDGTPVMSTRKYLMLTVALDRLLDELERDDLVLDTEEQRRQHALALTLAGELNSQERAAFLTQD